MTIIKFTVSSEDENANGYKRTLEVYPDSNGISVKLSLDSIPGGSLERRSSAITLNYKQAASLAQAILSIRDEMIEQDFRKIYEALGSSHDSD